MIDNNSIRVDSKNLCIKFSSLIKNSNNVFEQELLRTSLDISNDIAEGMKCTDHTNTIKLYKLANSKIYRLKNMLYLYTEYNKTDYEKFLELGDICDNMSSLINDALNIH